MPKTATTAKTTTKKKATSAEQEVIEEIKEEQSSADITAELLALLKEIKSENEALKEDIKNLKEQSKKEETVTGVVEEKTDNTADLLKTLAETIVKANVDSGKRQENLRSNREVKIIHNAQLFGGLRTVMHLSTTDIQFQNLGESRMVSWEQFEEMCCNYPGFIAKGIVTIAPEYEDVCKDHGIKTYKTGNNTKLEAKDLHRIGTMDAKELTNFYNSLNEVDQKVLLNYWMGKCYARPEERDKNFYDRYKLELLNHLSNSSVFYSILTDMNQQQP